MQTRRHESTGRCSCFDTNTPCCCPQATRSSQSSQTTTTNAEAPPHCGCQLLLRLQCRGCEGSCPLSRLLLTALSIKLCVGGRYTVKCITPYSSNLGIVCSVLRGLLSLNSCSGSSLGMVGYYDNTKYTTSRLDDSSEALRDLKIDNQGSCRRVS